MQRRSVPKANTFHDQVCYQRIGPREIETQFIPCRPRPLQNANPPQEPKPPAQNPKLPPHDSNPPDSIRHGACSRLSLARHSARGDEGAILGPAPRFASRVPREQSGHQDFYETSEPAPRSAPRTDGQAVFKSRQNVVGQILHLHTRQFTGMITSLG